MAAVAISPEVTSDFDRQSDVTTSSEVLARMAKHGDSGAFEKLMQCHYRFCLKKAQSILRNHSDAEDEVQNACVLAWKHISEYRAEGCFKAWLVRIVVNQCLTLLRTQKRRLVSLDQVFGSDNGFQLEVIDQGKLSENEVGDGELSQLLDKEIRGVPPLLREVLIMHDVGQITMPDIAECLGITLSAAKSRLVRARHELKQRMAKHFGQRGGDFAHQNPHCRQAAYVRAS